MYVCVHVRGLRPIGVGGIERICAVQRDREGKIQLVHHVSPVDNTYELAKQVGEAGGNGGDAPVPLEKRPRLRRTGVYHPRLVRQEETRETPGDKKIDAIRVSR